MWLRTPTSQTEYIEQQFRYNINNIATTRQSAHSLCVRPKAKATNPATHLILNARHGSKYGLFTPPIHLKAYHNT
jgi:hypothetical protein